MRGAPARRTRGARRRFFVHPTALVESDTVGDGTRIWAFAHVMEGARIGAHCNIGDHAFVEAGAEIGDHVTVKNGVMIWSGVTIRDGAFIGPGVLFTNDLRPRARRWPRLGLDPSPAAWLCRTVVEEGASLGAGTVVLGGVTVGAFAMVGAGSVVTKTVPPHGLGHGCPFRRSGYVCACGIPVPRRPRTGGCAHR